MMFHHPNSDAAVGIVRAEIVRATRREMEKFLAVEIDELYAVAAIHALRALLLPEREYEP